MSLIHISNLTFGYDGSYDLIFEDVSLQLDTDWRLGLSGRNGRGKTTFLQLLMGRWEHRGTISSSVEFDYFPFEVKDPQRSALEIVEELCPEAELWCLQREMSLLELEAELLDRPFSTLSNGEQTKLLLATLFLREHHFLLIDEPTNHLDLHARQVVSRYLQGKKGFILVSHDRTFLDGCIDHILSINRTDIELQRGNFSSWQLNKERQDSFEQGENQRLTKEARRLKDVARRTSQWSNDVEKSKYATRDSGLRPDRGYIGHKSAKMMKRAKVTERRREQAAEDASQLLRNVETAEALIIKPLSYHQNLLVEARDLSVGYGGQPVFEGVSFTVERGDRVALCGPNGCGKSSLLKLIAGQPIEHSGLLRLGSGVVLSLLPQDASFLQGDMGEFSRENDLDESLFKAILRKLGFERVQFEKDLSALSGGQKKKVLIARSLCQSAHLYLWDEPLNYIDLLSRLQIEQLILEHCPTMLMVEHDQAFVTAVATKQVNL